MTCPKCGNESTMIGNSHYMCTNVECVDDNKRRTQFVFEPDKEVEFPSNQIFKDRQKDQFFRKPYLQINHKRNK